MHRLLCCCEGCIAFHYFSVIWQDHNELVTGIGVIDSYRDLRQDKMNAAGEIRGSELVGSFHVLLNLSF